VGQTWVVEPLLAAPSREPSDAATLWSHAVQDSGATRASGVGEPPTGLRLDHESDRGAEKCRRSGSKEVQFRSSGFSGDAKMAPSVAHGSTSHWKPD